MKIIITAKDKDLDKTVDEVMNIANKIKGKIIGERCICDGTSIIIKK